jgi:hypothetical protein
VRIENNSFLPTTATTGTYYGIGYEVANTSHNQILIRGNSYIQPVAAQTAVHVPVALFASNGPMTNVRIEDNNFYLNPHVSGSFIGLLASSASAPATGIVISGNSMRSSGAGPGAGIIHLGAVETLVTGNSIRADSLVSMGSAPGGACSVLISNNLLFGRILPGPCGGGVTAVGNSDQHGYGVLTGVPANLVRAYRNAGVTFTAGTNLILVYNVENVDLAGSYDTGTGTFLTQVAGWFRVRACARMSATNFAAGDTADIAIISGASNLALNRVVSGGSSSFTNCVEDLIRLGPAGTFQVQVSASGAANTRTISGTGTYSTYLSVERVSD